MSGTVTSAVFYYGIDLPADRSWAASLQHAKIVLQPYHPLLRTGQFTTWFPRCSLYTYWNPTGVAADALDEAAERIELLEPDPVWNLERLDLRSAATRRFAVSRGLAALHGADVAGLFVDDLDRWSDDSRQDAAIEIVSSLLAQVGRDVRLFVNRAFALWPRLPRIAAVLLEELTPGLVDKMPAAAATWVQHCVLPAVREIRRRDADVFGLTYEPPPEDLPRSPAAAELAGLSDAILHGCRSLDIWPEEVR